ncbi:MAG: hypothetical protein ACOCUP_00435 [bacterium]
MTAYNCGYYQIKDAQALANANQLNENNVWEENVEEMVLAPGYSGTYNMDIVKYGYVRRTEPVTYVELILERCDHYIKFINE